MGARVDLLEQHLWPPSIQVMMCRDTDLSRGYHLHERKLGEGGFGSVKLATHVLTKQKVAVKIIDKVKIKKDLFRVQTEINALRVLQHKNIARLLQVIYSDKYIYLVLEYCSGGELFDYLIRHRRLAEKETKRIIRSLVSVLGFIHSKGFAHRDIKPENILLDEAGNIKLIDFGLSADSNTKPSGTLDGLTTACGSPAYVAPELLIGDGYNGPAADIWSTGVLMYTLLVGKLPFADVNTASLYKKIKAASFVMPPDLSPHAQDLLRQMICKDPQKRVTVEQILAHPWLNAIPFSLKLPFGLSSANSYSEIDDNILLKCAALFPDYKNLNHLRERVIYGFGYETATYWLVNTNPENFTDLEQLSKAGYHRRSMSFSEFNSPNAGNMLKRKNDATEELPMKKPPNSEVKPKASSPKKAINTKARPLVAKKLFESELQATSTPPKVERRKFTPMPLTPHPFPVSSRMPKMDTFKKPETPFKKLKSDGEPLLDETPRKSLFRKLLESATPRKATSPRRITMNDHNARAITVTPFTDIDKCKDFIMKVMENKRLNCTVNNFSLRCVLSAQKTVIVALELELLICRDTGCVAIKTRRVSGNSIDYLLICEHLKKKVSRSEMCK